MPAVKKAKRYLARKASDFKLCEALKIASNTLQRKTTRYSSQNVLSGLLVCAECRSNYRRAIITSYSGDISEIKGEATGEARDTENRFKFAVYKQMLGGKDIDVFETEVKEKFIKNPKQMRLLIVVDKLLTGFDAPSATYLYIDKSIRDHGLFRLCLIILQRHLIPLIRMI